MTARLNSGGLLVQKVRGDRPASQQVVAIPHAGAGPNTVASWEKALRPGIEMLFIRLPGRETRFREPPLENAREAGCHVASALRLLPSLPTILLGHSMGSLIAYLAAVQLEESGFNHLAGLIVSGFNPPDAEVLCPRVNGMSDEEFVMFLDGLGGLPQSLLADRELLHLLLPLLRADFRLVEDYQHGYTKPLSIPIVAISGTQDRLAPSYAAIGWNKHTVSGFHSIAYEGDHFAVIDSDGTWTSAVSRALALVLDTKPRQLPCVSHDIPFNI